MSEKTIQKTIPKLEEEAEEIVAIFCKNITDKKKKNAIDLILDRVVMKMIPEANTIDEDLKMLLKDIFNYFIKAIKKPVIQNFINSGKNPNDIFRMLLLDFIDHCHSQVCDNFDKQDYRCIYKLLMEYIKKSMENERFS